MGYRIVGVADVEPEPDRSSQCRKLSGPGELDKMAINHFTPAPGEEIPLAYHYHDEQEEAFYVLDGTLSVETPEGIFEVEEDELFVVDPGSPQRAFVPDDADGPATVLAIGAPPADGDVHAYEPDDE